MTRTVFKYPLGTDFVPVPDSQCDLLLPSSFQPVHFGRDPQGELCLWALVDPDTPPRRRRFLLVGTGWELPDAYWRHVGTMVEGPFVWHLFREMPSMVGR